MRKLLLFFLSVAAGMTLGRAMPHLHTVFVEARAQERVSEPRELDRFIAAFERIRTHYVDRLDQSQLIDAAIRGMVGMLASQSSYIAWPLFRDMQVSFRDYVGFAVAFSAEKGHAKVIAPIDVSPAAKARLRTNDIITHVDSTSLEGFTLDHLLNKLIGPVDNQVRLTVLREGQGKPVELTLVRHMTPFKTVRSRLEGGDIGYLRIPRMNEWTMPALEKAIGELSNQIPANKLKAYVLMGRALQPYR
jgi:carboxyl-terminal processing protease